MRRRLIFGIVFSFLKFFVEVKHRRIERVLIICVVNPVREVAVNLLSNDISSSRL